jgi:hypothetical protein
MALSCCSPRRSVGSASPSGSPRSFRTGAIKGTGFQHRAAGIPWLQFTRGVRRRKLVVMDAQIRDTSARPPRNSGNIRFEATNSLSLIWRRSSNHFGAGYIKSPPGILPDHGRRDLRRAYRIPFLMYGMLLACFGLGMYLFGVLLVVPRYLLGLNAILLPINEWIVWYSGVPIAAGLVLALGDLVFLFRIKRRRNRLRVDDIANRRLTVALTAYNDEESIGTAVSDFLSHPMVRRVLVVSNNSTDTTFERAVAAGAITVNESAPGYGRCVFRCLCEAINYDDTDLIVLCEGDRTFRAFDLDKLVAFAPHADIVNGTRTVECLRQYSTQLSTFMYYGNLFVGKLLEAKHLGRSTITDVGTTYKLCRKRALSQLLPQLYPAVNLEFNAHFLDTALESGLTIVECPITFHSRVGVSKGGNTSDLRALKVGCRMMIGIIFAWKWLGK